MLWGFWDLPDQQLKGIYYERGNENKEDVDLNGEESREGRSKKEMQKGIIKDIGKSHTETYYYFISFLKNIKSLFYLFVLGSIKAN